MPHPHRSRLPIWLIWWTLSVLFPLAALADGERVATILVQGLHRIERERLLTDLHLREGDVYETRLPSRLEDRAQRLPYLEALRVESESGQRGWHLTLWVREASRLRLRPFFMVLEDGDLGGGFHIDSDGLLTRRERWRGTLLAGGRTDISLALRDLRFGSKRSPGLNFDVGIRDWDQPFWDTQSRQWWILGGLSFNLPGSGSLLLMGGREWIETTPPRGYDPLGEDEHPLYRVEWRQGILQDHLSARFELEHRRPGDAEHYSRGFARLEARTRRGRWLFTGRADSGRAMNTSPVTGLYYLDSWRYLRAFDAGSLPAREFHFLRLRGDVRIFTMPVSLKRGGPEQPVIYSFFFLAEGALLRRTRSLDFTDASDLGLGVALRLPGPIPTRASFGILWNNIGEVRSVFILEEI